MYGYIFETTNTKTGDTYLGKRYAVKFDKDYFGEENDSALAVAIEKYGRPLFKVKMIMPYEERHALNLAYDEMARMRAEAKIKTSEPKEEKPKRKKVEEPVVEMPEQKESSDSSGPEEEPVVKEEPKLAKRGRKKKVIENEGK